MENNFQDIELFWDSITREKMTEVGEDAPFDFMYRGKYLPENNSIRSVKLGDNAVSVDVDMVNVDMESFYIRIYEVEFGSTTESFSPDLADQRGPELGRILENTENNWRYDSSLVIFDHERTYEPHEAGLLQGSVYWPELTREHPEDVYQDVNRIFGEDIISKL